MSVSSSAKNLSFPDTVGTAEECAPEMGRRQVFEKLKVVSSPARRMGRRNGGCRWMTSWRSSSHARGDNRSNFLSGLLETDAIVLHCDERHRPAAWRLCFDLDRMTE
jgi:hypothetical protein